jgi:ABC-type amino acid transport substrate-binding protein/cytochrome c5
MLTLGKVKQTLGAVALVAGAMMAQQASADTLRVCTDPDNLPFSKMDGAEKGVYVELAEKVASRMGSTVEYVWWLSYNQRKALRNTIMQDSCDAYFSLPADADYRVRGVNKTPGFLNVSYAIVAAKGQTFKSLEDLKNKRVAVLHSSPPHILLASREGFTTTSFIAQEAVFAALNKGEVDVALLWGPSAGYENMKDEQSRWQVIPVKGEGLGGAVAVAVPKSKPELQARIEKALQESGSDIQALTQKYGFPTSAPIELAFKKTATPVHTAHAASQKSGFTKVAATNKDTEWVLAQADVPDAAAGKMFFNNTCSHCHGTNGASPVSERDIRKLKTRYKENWKETALTTIRNGRPDLGMPTWKGVIKDQDILNIVAFFETIQK